MAGKVNMEIEANRSPNYYVKRRLIKNKPAVFGLIVIILAAITAVLGYLVMPDQTPNANDGAVQIQKKLPGFSTVMIRHRKNMRIERPGLFRKIFFGSESEYVIEPVANYRTEGWNLVVQPYGGLGREKTYSLVDVAMPLYAGDLEGTGFEGKPYWIEDETMVYLDFNNQVNRISRSELLKVFEKNNVKRRTYLLGTDNSGRDILSRLMFGARISLSIGLAAVIISMILGITIGAIAGYFGGRIDHIAMWLMSVVWSIPGIMLVIAISMALQSRGVWVAFVAVGLTMWVDVARVVRGQMMSIRQKLYIEAARAFGISSWRIVFRHIMPNIFGPLIVIASSNFAAAILLEAGLSFLGLSVQPPTPSWGIMIYEGYHAIGSENSWHLVVFPGLVICLMILSFNLLGNGLRDAFDPQTSLN